jgi:hypothetical protein
MRLDEKSRQVSENASDSKTTRSQKLGLWRLKSNNEHGPEILQNKQTS